MDDQKHVERKKRVAKTNAMEYHVLLEARESQEHIFKERSETQHNVHNRRLRMRLQTVSKMVLGTHLNDYMEPV